MRNRRGYFELEFKSEIRISKSETNSRFKNRNSKRICLEHSNFDDPVKSLLGRHPGEPRIRSGAGAGVHPAKGGIEITGFRLSSE